MLEKKEFAAKLRETLESNLSLSHPIFAELFKEQKNWPLLRLIGMQGYHLSRAFLTYIETLFYKCPLKEHKEVLLYNMYEEFTGNLSGTKNHIDLMLDFVNAIGIPTEQAEKDQILPATAELIDYRMDMVKGDDTYHIGAAAVLIASEGQSLETRAGEARHSILGNYYGLTEQDTLFFSVHQQEDVNHVAQGIRLVTDLCTTEKMQQEAIEAVDKTCKLFYGMYEGVAQNYYQSKVA